MRLQWRWSRSNRGREGALALRASRLTAVQEPLRCALGSLAEPVFSGGWSFPWFSFPLPKVPPTRGLVSSVLLVQTPLRRTRRLLTQLLR